MFCVFTRDVLAKLNTKKMKKKEWVKGAFKEWKDSHNATTKHILDSVTEETNMRRTLKLWLFVACPILAGLLVWNMIAGKRYLRSSILLVILGLMWYQSFRIKKAYGKTISVNKFKNIVSSVQEQMGGKIGGKEKKNGVQEPELRERDTPADTGQDSDILPRVFKETGTNQERNSQQDGLADEQDPEHQDSDEEE